MTRETRWAREAFSTTCIIIGIPAKRRRGLPGNLVEEYRAGMIATAAPFTGFQPSLKRRSLSNRRTRFRVTGDGFLVDRVFKE